MAVNDHWTLDLERLGMEGAGDELARLILRCHPPYAICVQGKWGAGKTSVLRYAMARLGGEPLALSLKTQKKPTSELDTVTREAWSRLAAEAPELIKESLGADLLSEELADLERRARVVPIWFNPWQHQESEQPAVALLQEIRAQFTALAKLGNEAKKLGSVSIEAGLSMLGELIDTVAVLQGGVKLGVGKGFGSIRKIGEDYEQRNFEGRPDAQRARLLFEEAVDRLLRPEAASAVDSGYDGNDIAIRRLVVFIDDLDRCTDEPTVRLLEAIKLYLQTRNCVFVFGMDGSAARRAVERLLPHGAEEAQEYLEKLFQATVHVPMPMRRRAFLEELIKRHKLDHPDVTRSELAELLDSLLEPNPRKLKNFLGGLAVSWRIYRRTRPSPTARDLRFFVLLSYLRSYHPDVARLLGYDPSQVRVLHEVLQTSNRTGRPPAHASPAALLLHRRFRHAFEGVETRDDGTGGDEVVADFLERLDRAKGDRALVRFWLHELKQATGEEVQRLLEPMLHFVLTADAPVEPPAPAEVEDA